MGDKIYPSPTTPGLMIDLPNFLVETSIKCAAEDKKTRVPPYFWKMAEWKQIYTYEIKAARNLLKIFGGNQDVIIDLATRGILKTFHYPTARFMVEKAISEKKFSEQNVSQTNIIDKDLPQKALTRRTNMSRTMFSKLE